MPLLIRNGPRAHHLTGFTSSILDGQLVVQPLDTILGDDGHPAEPAVGPIPLYGLGHRLLQDQIFTFLLAHVLLNVQISIHGVQHKDVPYLVHVVHHTIQIGGAYIGCLTAIPAIVTHQIKNC
jgi:hypothetical protein